MNREENIKRLYKQAKLNTLVERDKAVLEKMKEIYLEERKTGPKTDNFSIWRIIMKSKISKLAAAAVIIIACSISLIFWKNTGSGIALADVLEKLEQVTTYKYNVRTTIKKQNNSHEKLSTILVSRDHGIKISETLDPNNNQSPTAGMYVLPQQNVIAVIMHEHRMYTLIKFDDKTELEEYKQENNDPYTTVRNLLSLDQTSLGQSTIDGRKVEGFRITDPNYTGSFVKTSDFRSKVKQAVVDLWVDVNTKLPVRLIEDTVRKNGAHIHEVSYDFEWNVEIKADDFNYTKPDGYQSIGDGLIYPASNEQATIKGLHYYSSLTNTYPSSLSNINSNKILGIELNEDGKPAWRKYSNDEANKISRDIATLAAPGFFYKELTENKKDPAYYGDSVGPEDTDKMLLRWKLDDGQYRVLFGDLTAKTVTAEELAELEKL